MNDDNYNDIENLFKGMRAPHVPPMPLRKNALRTVLLRRVVSPTSPYVHSLRVLVPAVLLLLLVFWGVGGKDHRAVMRVVTRAQDATNVLSESERTQIIRSTGFDPDQLLQEINASRDAKIVQFSQNEIVTEDMAPALRMAKSAAPAPTAFYESGEDNSVTESDGTRAEVLPLGGGGEMMLMATPTSDTFLDVTTLLPPVTFVTFTGDDGNVVTIGFDENFVPVSRVVTPPL